MRAKRLLLTLLCIAQFSLNIRVLCALPENEQADQSNIESDLDWVFKSPYKYLPPWWSDHAPPVKPTPDADVGLNIAKDADFQPIYDPFTSVLIERDGHAD
jgi:hypothetical protein